jgi:uncharacterized protein YoxC
MNTIIAFTLKDLLLSGVYLILILVLFYLLKILITTQRSLKDINNLVKENRIQIDAVLKEAPEIAKNANTISEEVAHDISRFRTTVDNIADTSEEVTGVIKDNKSVVSGLTSIFHTASIAKGAYDKFFNKDSDEEEENTAKED